MSQPATLVVVLNAPPNCEPWLEALERGHMVQAAGVGTSIRVERPASIRELNDVLYQNRHEVVVLAGRRPRGRWDAAIEFQGQVLGVRDTNALLAEHNGGPDWTHRQVVWVLDGPPYGPWSGEGDVVVQTLGATADAIGVAQMTMAVSRDPLSDDPGYPSRDSILAMAISEQGTNSEFDGGYNDLLDTSGNTIDDAWVGSDASGNPLAVHLTTSSLPSGGFLRNAMSWTTSPTAWPQQFQIGDSGSGDVYVDPRSVASRYPLRRFRGPLVSPHSIVATGDQVWKWATNQQPPGYGGSREGYVILRNDRQLWLELAQGSARYSYPFIGSLAQGGGPVDFAEVAHSSLPPSAAYLWFIADPLP